MFNISQEFYRLSKTENLLIVWFPVIMLGVFSALLLTPESRWLSNWLLQENRPIEWLQFASFLLAGFYAFRICIQLTPQAGWIFYFFVSIALGSLFVAMEEISWGQWLLFFDPPDAIKSINKQGELNIHNLPILHEIFEIARVLFAVGGLLTIVLVKHSPWNRIGAPTNLTFWFVLIFILGILDLFNHNVRPEGNLLLLWAYQLTEVLELLIAISVFLYVFLKYKVADKWIEVRQ